MIGDYGLKGEPSLKELEERWGGDANPKKVTPEEIPNNVTGREWVKMMRENATLKATITALESDLKAERMWIKGLTQTALEYSNRADKAEATIIVLEAEKAELEIVCICGSSKFVGEMAIHAWEYAKQGVLALSCYLLPEWYDMPPDHGAEYEGVADILDALHLQKIDMADRVFIVNVDGYIGDRTHFEIEYATKAGKPIEYLEPLDELLKQEHDSCKHGKGLTDYCEPCGRVNGG